MPELDQERLQRLRGWKSDLERMVADAERADDKRVLDAAKGMLAQCKQFITEAERTDDT